MPGLTLEGIAHRYWRGPLVLDGIDATFRAGETVALMGPSGSGKTTMLSICGLLTQPTSGTVSIDGEPVSTRGKDRDRLRAELFSWVFQTVNVLGTRSARDNTSLGLLARGIPRPEASRASDVALRAVGLAQRAADRVNDLSGGELQRVCIARAMAAAPRFVLADEPTGQLDRTTSDLVLDALWAARDPGTTLIIATHDPTVARRCDTIINLVDGTIQESHG
jgi:ABC-type lipoprotein export system ATPase subunit